MADPKLTDVLRCDRCEAIVSRSALRCSRCGKRLPDDATHRRATAAELASTSAGTFLLSTLLLLMALVAVALAVARVSGQAAAVFSVLGTLSLLCTAAYVRHQYHAGRHVGVPDKIVAFWTIFAVIATSLMVYIVVFACIAVLLVYVLWRLT